MGTRAVSVVVAALVGVGVVADETLLGVGVAEVGAEEAMLIPIRIGCVGDGDTGTASATATVETNARGSGEAGCAVVAAAAASDKCTSGPRPGSLKRAAIDSVGIAGALVVEERVDGGRGGVVVVVVERCVVDVHDGAADWDCDGRGGVCVAASFSSFGACVGRNLDLSFWRD